MFKLRRTISIILIVAITAQINLDILVSDFKVSLGLVFLSIYLYQNRNLNVMIIGLLSGISVFIFRTLTSILMNSTIESSVTSFYPEIFFYTVFGLMFTILIKRENSYKLRKYFFIIMFCDFIANFVELFIRVRFDLITTNVDNLFIILLVAICRASVVSLVILAFRYYKNILLKEEHQNRYHNLLTLTSKLKAEMYWADKSLNNIESVMTEAYELYDQLNSSEHKDLANKAIDIAKDIHEIKKEVGLIVRGVDDVTKSKFDDDGISVSDIFKILNESLTTDIRNSDKDIVINFKCSNDLKVLRHYYMMSILRNLVYNSFDAIEKKGVIKISHEVFEENSVFTICDNGVGIDKDNIEHIFQPGYSTKIDYDTGSINRGLGLSIVKDITERFFEGEIKCESTPGDTCFTIIIKNKRLEG